MTAILTPPPAAPLAGTAPATAPRPPRRRVLSVLALLGGTALIYLWSLSASGYANSFYSAAAQAGGESWKAWFFGSLDPGNAITVDKPPASLWLMGLSVRAFGLSSWSILVPEALLGVACVGLVYATVKRTSGHAAGLIAGAATALTPAAALMFRFNNPDALLLVLLVGSGYAMTRALEAARTRWVVLAGVLVGFAFLTKMLQGFLVLPAFALVYLIAAPTPVRRRLLQLLAALAAVIVSAGWWIAIVALVPASARPYVDGSTSNSILQLALGYNGLGRITGDETGGLGNAGFSSGVGILRLFGGVSGGMVTWLLPGALILMIGGVALRGRAPRTDRVRAALLMSGGTMITTGLVFSFMGGIYHDYYTVALAPWIAMTAVIGFAEVWRHRDDVVGFGGHAGIAARAVLALSAAASTVWAFVLLGQAGSQPWDTLRWLVLLLGTAATTALAWVHRATPALRNATLGVLLAAVLIGPASYSIQTIGTAHTGSIVTAGPVSSMGGGFGGPGGGRGGGFGGPGGQAGQGTQGGTPPTGQGGQQGGPGGQTGGRPGGGVIGGGTADSDLTALLTESADGGDYRWDAATVGAQNAATYQLASDSSVMAIGGFNGTTPSITLAQFQAYVAAGDIHYFIPGSGMGGGQSGGTSDASAITSWVEQNFTATSVGSTTVYDLTGSSATGEAS